MRICRNGAEACQCRSLEGYPLVLSITFGAWEKAMHAFAYSDLDMFGLQTGQLIATETSPKPE